MSALKRLVLFVEGEGDEKAVPLLVNHLLTEQNAWDCLFLDPHPFRVGGVENLIDKQEYEWVRFLTAARKRRALGGVLLLLDGDLPKRKGMEFCAADIARDLASRARQAGAGTLFSVAVVFALQEYESWLIGSIETLAGKRLPPDERLGVPADVKAPEGDLEIAPRGAKGWLNNHMAEGYKPTLDQAPLTRLAVENLEPLRKRNLRSFQRLENAMQQLIEAIRTGNPIATPE